MTEYSVSSQEYSEKGHPVHTSSATKPTFL